MTLNQVQNKISAICLAHKQIKSFYQGMLTDWLNDQTTKYPGSFLENNGGTISVAGHSATLNFDLLLVDLVNISEETNANLDDVQSDMFSVAMDIVAQLARSENEWILSPDEAVVLWQEKDNDLHAGVSFSFSIRFQYDQNICEIPTTFSDYTPTDTNMEAFDLPYIADGTEGTTLVIPALVGKKILLITRESSILYKVVSAPDSVQYVWNGTVITLGLPTLPGARFLILYRNY